MSDRMQYPQQSQPPKKDHTVRNAILGALVGFVLLIAAIGIGAGGGSESSTANSDTQTPSEVDNKSEKDWGYVDPKDYPEVYGDDAQANDEDDTSDEKRANKKADAKAKTQAKAEAEAKAEDEKLTVVLEIIAEGSGSVTYMKPDMNISQDTSADFPWVKTLEVDPGLGASTVSVNAQHMSGGGVIRCKITIDGEVITKNKSEGQYAVVMCN